MRILLALAFLGILPLPAEPVRLKGSDVLGAKLVPMLCDEYRKQHPGFQFEIAAEGTVVSIPMLREGTIDILMAHRPLAVGEIAGFEKAGIVLERRLAVTDAFVIAVHASNPITNLTHAQVERLFTGDDPNWKSVGGNDAPVVVHIRNSSSSAFKDFRVAAMKGRPYARGAVKLAGGDSLAEVIAKDPNGIGYLGLAMAPHGKLKAVKVDGIDPPGKDASRYPLLCPRYYYHRSGTRPEVLALVRWMTESPEASAIVKRIGWLAPD